MSTHGQRAPGQTTITFVVHTDIKQRLRAKAKKEKRTLSNYLAKTLEEIVVREEQADYDEAETRRVLSAQLPAPVSPEAQHTERRSAQKKKVG